MIPVLMVPAIRTPYGMPHKVKKMGMVSMGDSGLPRKQGVEVKGFNQYINFARPLRWTPQDCYFSVWPSR